MTDSVLRRVTVETAGLTLSLIIWRRYRAPMFGLAERVLALNPGLAALGLVLPIGTTFLLPDESEAPPPVAVISLWE